MTATITSYGVGLFIHIFAVVLAFGPTYGYAIFIATAENNAPHSVPTVLRAIQRADRLLVTPGMVVILLAGIYLLSKAHISVSESWVGVGFVAIFALFGMAHSFFRPNAQKALDLAERDLAAGDTLSSEYEAISKKIATGGKIAGAIVAVTIFFMVVKP